MKKLIQIIWVVFLFGWLYYLLDWIRQIINILTIKKVYWIIIGVLVVTGIVVVAILEIGYQYGVLEKVWGFLLEQFDNAKNFFQKMFDK